MARPSSSRTIGQPTTSTGKSRSRAMRRTIGELLEVLLAEVGPARSGDVEQLGHDRRDAGEVGRPGRALHRWRPVHRPRPWWRPARGYISSTDGVNTWSTPQRLAQARVAAGRGDSRPGPRPAPNCSGLTKIVTATTSHSAPARASTTGARRAGSPSSARGRRATRRRVLDRARRGTTRSSRAHPPRQPRRFLDASAGSSTCRLVSPRADGPVERASRRPRARPRAARRDGVGWSPRRPGPRARSARRRGPSSATLSTVARTRSR